ncbi:MAG: UDP-glucose--hexose-1-phosphate uridylyltransferase [Elusimicrobiota bacterium]|nr:UDP-glucose--hexose-1-phosphate uridylyltransferase [Elusimicrobiota bacterium]
MKIHFYICELLDYGVANGLIKEDDRFWAANRIIDELGLTSFEARKTNKTRKTKTLQNLPKYPTEILAKISQWAVENRKIKDLPIERELLETAVIGSFLQRPSDFIAKFNQSSSKQGIKTALCNFYEQEKRVYYIKVERIQKNIVWKTKTKYGTFDITINLSKPERTPQEIIAVKELGTSALSKQDYPKCVLCPQNEGYAGRLNYPPRQNVRLIPLTLNNEHWFFQFSPYVYYNEHSIILAERHTDMKIDKKTFARFADFLDKIPHYFIGSNADLPIVGGSILNHDHYQGGNYSFPLYRAKTLKTFKLKKFPKVVCSILCWPMSIVRIVGQKKDIVGAASHIFNVWKSYSDKSLSINSYSVDDKKNRTPHNTITPLAKMTDGKMQMDLVLRNNCVSKDFPDGIFHTDPRFFHIKRENMGLIESLGLAVLPGRLKNAMEKISGRLIAGKIDEIKKDKETADHYCWAVELANKYKFTVKNSQDILKKEIGLAFVAALECCKIFKDTPAGAAGFNRFVERLNR